MSFVPGSLVEVRVSEWVALSKSEGLCCMVVDTIVRADYYGSYDTVQASAP